MGLRGALSSLVFGPSMPTLASLDLRSRGRKSAITPGGDVATGSSRWGYGWSDRLPSTKVDYKTEAGDLNQNAIVMACCQWIGRTFPEAPLRVMQLGKAGAVPLPDHPLTKLLRHPNDYYNGLLLWSATLTDLNISGNGYWLKVRNKASGVAELWYEPSYSCRPVWDTDSTAFIDGYQVRRNGQWLTVPGGRSNIIHYRVGLDPRNPRLGLSSLASALREVFTDNEAANFTARLVSNTGIPGLLVSPAVEGYTIDDAPGLKRALIANFGGDRRGEPMVMEGPTKAETIGFSPEQMNLEKIRNIPEERITALIGIPAIVAGLGSGLDHATYHNMGEAYEAAYHNNLIPTQRLLAAQLDVDLLPDFGDAEREIVEFDRSKVQALAADEDKLYGRLDKSYRAGWIKRSEARQLSGANLPTTTEDEVYITDLITLGARITEVDPAGTLEGADRDLGKDIGGLPLSKELALPNGNGHATRGGQS